MNDEREALSPEPAPLPEEVSDVTADEGSNTQAVAPAVDRPQKGKVRIALDVMGGDNAPQAIVEGAILAIKTIDGVEITMVGDENAIKAELEKHSFEHPSLHILHAEEAIQMDEAPSVALRKKRKSSIHIGIKTLKNAEVDAFISAGNTGAVMAVSTVILRNLEEIDRAAIAIPLPTQTGHAVLLDAGANVSCKALHLYQFGIMGSMYAQYVLDDEKPRVGLLSIGEEDIKGNETTKEAFEMLSQSSINFVGNTEAKLLYRGVADVVVCDGFTGNIALKISESVAEMIGVSLKAMFSDTLRGKLGYFFLRPFLADFKKRIDHSEVGGAPLLGVNGAVFICHGSSNAKAIKNAIIGAKKFVEGDVNGHIKESLAKNKDVMNSRLLRDQHEGLWTQVKRKIGLNAEENQET
ncbi:Phosphate:acyl-ACP acyltransferase PlsX (EC 2.3.1.n2) [hydrothermal vent metagenome]|uniref:phosphate acyltransferase n=1 Tax=hydrothermal vent metagenome TaxID=652676 RepID=A0A3B1CDW8_9ZZZZ